MYSDSSVTRAPASRSGLVMASVPGKHVRAGGSSPKGHQTQNDAGLSALCDWRHGAMRAEQMQRGECGEARGCAVV